jgi:Cu/Ag efflux pump CusA
VHANRLQRETGDPFGPELVRRAVSERFAPTLMAAAATALAMAPFAIAGSIAGNEITHSVAAVVLGGLVTATAFSLFLTPALYIHFGHGVREEEPQPAVPAAATAVPELNA